MGDSVGGGSTHDIYSIQPTVNKIAGGGAHQLRIGYDARSYRENAYGPGHAAGQYSFGTNFTRGPLDNSPGAPIGQEYAAFLLGQTTGGSIDRNASRSNQTLYHAVFFHDDWKIGQNLTLNLGVRYEYEGATNERYNRNTAGFDAATASPIEARAKTAYAAAPIPQISPANFNVKGGLLFAGPSNRPFWNADRNNIQPRLGLAWRFAPNTVLRGGWGVYAVPFIIAGSNQPGFSQATNIVPTLNAGVTFVANLANPFPNGVADPPGAGDGLGTFIGRGISYIPRDASNAMSQRFELGVQHEVRGWLLQGGYVGNRGYDLTVGTGVMNTVPRQYLSTSPERDQATIDLLSGNVANPFRGLAPGTGLDGTTVGRSQLLRPFPQFTGISIQRYDGSSNYNSFQAKVERRFSRGFTILGSYTLSKLKEQVSFLNEVDTEYEERLAGADRRQRLVLSGIWELPFGRGRMVGANWGRALDAVLGGWQAQGIAQFQPGGPLNFDANYILRAAPASVALSGSAQTIDRWFRIEDFERTPARQLGSNYRTAQRQFPGVKQQGLHLWDLSIIKVFSITESVRLQLRGEFLNAFNHAQFSDPNRTPTDSNFGRITGQSNLPRNVQIGMRMVF